MPEPYTQSITLSWSPELRFFESRYGILRGLQDGGDMWAFHSGESVIQARLFDVSHQLTVRGHSASLHLLTPDPQSDRAWRVLAFAVSTIQPRQPAGMSATLQYIDPLPLDFDAAVRRAYGTILRVPGTDDIQPDDWALLIDLKVREPAGATGQTEFGIVRAREVPVRLRRDITRVTFADRPALAPDQWNSDEFAPVSLFVDVTFTAPAVPGAGALDALHSFWDAMRGEAGNLVSKLRDQLVSTDNNERKVAP